MNMLPTLFEEQVAKNPTKIAVEFDGKQLSYRQVNQLANQVAQQLIDKNLVAETIVAIYISRSVNMLVAILGVLKAGCVYVPVDSQSPPERVKYILDDTQCAVLLTVEALAQELETEVDLIFLDGVQERNEQYSNPQITFESKSLALVIYTSGTTGLPKGVMIEHRNLAAMLAAVQLELKLSDSDVMMAITSISFDIHTIELLLPLIHGAKIIIQSAETIRSPAKLLRSITDHQISIMQATPTIWQTLIDRQWAPKYPIRLISGGEAMTSQLSQALLVDNVIGLYNMYGPTETTVYSTFKSIVRDSPITIGKAIDKTRAYVFDRRLRLVPKGAVGELYIGGRGVTRGYLNNDELTKEKYIINPLDKNKRDRLYRTGDQVRLLANDELEYIGRVDRQIKRRGIRIELGEIENNLIELAYIDQCVVMLKSETRDGNGDDVLVGFLVSKLDCLDLHQVNRDFRAKVPEPLVPDLFVRLDSLPMMTNGKVDLKLLSQMNVQKASHSDTNTSDVVSDENYEVALRALYKQLLKRENVGLDDNFFSLGGHSLLAMQLQNILASKFSIEVNLNDLFDHPTIRQLNRFMQQAENSSGIEVVSIKETTYPISFLQAHMLKSSRGKPDALYNATIAASISQGLDVDALDCAIDAIFKRHDILRTKLYRQKDQLWQLVEPYANEALPLNKIKVDEVFDETKVINGWLKDELKKPFAIVGQQLIRINLLSYRDDHYLLAISMHHIIYDGWSISQLLGELISLYHRFVENKNMQIDPAPFQYIDFCYWQRQHIDGQRKQMLTDYWLNHFSGKLPVFEFTSTKIKPVGEEFAADMVHFNLPNELRRKVEQVCEILNVSPFIYLLSLFNVLLKHHTGAEDIIVGVPVANRKKEQFLNILGFFSNAIAFRSDLSGDPQFSSLVQQVRKTVLEGFEHEEMPMILIEEALYERDPQTTIPIFQTLFVYQNEGAKGSEVSIPTDLMFKTLNLKSAYAKRNLTLIMAENEAGYVGGIEFNSGLFHVDAVGILCEHYRLLIERSVAQVDTKIGQLGEDFTAVF